MARCERTHLSTVPYDAVRIPKAAAVVAETLRRQIILGELSANDSLPAEAVLISQFGVSRPTLREAFRILESEALIDVRRGARGGARVCPPDGTMAARHLGYLLQHRGTTMDDVYRARTMLEQPLGAAVAADQRRKTLARLENAISQASKHLDDPEVYARLDLEFHLLIADLAGNESIKTMVEVLYQILTPARTRYKEVLEPGELSGEHAEVHRTHAYFVTLVKRGDVEGAIKLWNKHLEEIELHFTARPLAKTVVEMIGL